MHRHQVIVLILLMAVGLPAVRCNDKLSESPLPVVLWHGMGDCCCNPLSMGRIKEIIQKTISDNNSYVLSLRIGNNIAEDTENGFMMNVNKQIEYACQVIRNDTKLRNGYHAVGFSQGGQFLRAVAQRCPDPPMLNLVSIGGQHQGVFGLPRCLHMFEPLCETFRKLITDGAYTRWIQNKFVQAQYWHDPLKEEEYINKSIFLADINNERQINYDYRKNLMALSNLILVMFEDDRMVVPKESSHFGFYAPGQDKVMQSMQDSVLYQADRIGLKYLFEQNRLHLLSIPGDHLQMTEKWFVDEIINVYLR